MKLMNPEDELIVCRCESVNLGQIQSTIRRSGAKTVNQVKKLTRAGMGPCQGRTCASTIESVLEIEADIPRGSEAFRARPPVRNLPIATLAASADQYREPTGPVSVVMLRTSDAEASEQDPSAEETD
jgi:bacterioferritin-associated ferredoxin